MIDNLNLSVEGHVKIWDPGTSEVFVNQHNAINSETMSLIIANSLAGPSASYIYEMHFGNGGVVIDETGNITYRDVSTNLESGRLASLFNPTYFKVIDSDDAIYNNDPTNNKVSVVHTEGLNYTDLVVTCTLAQNNPAINDYGNLVGVAQDELDQASDFDGSFVFNELGLKSKGVDGVNTGYLLSQIVFHPVQKSANRVIQVIYTLRIRIT